MILVNILLRVQICFFFRNPDPDDHTGPDPDPDDHTGPDPDLGDQYHTCLDPGDVTDLDSNFVITQIRIPWPDRSGSGSRYPHRSDSTPVHLFANKFWILTN